MNMRIGPNPAFLRIGIILGVLFTAGCADFDQQPPVSFGSVQIAEGSDNSAKFSRFAQLWMRVAWQAIEDGHPDTAIRFAQKAVEAYPESDEPLRILALAYRQKGGRDETPYLARNIPNPGSAARAGSRPGATVSLASARGAPLSTSYSVRPAERSPTVLSRTARGHQVTRPAGSSGRQTAVARLVVPEKSSAAAYRIQLAAYTDFDDATQGKNLLTRRLPRDFPSLGIFFRHSLTADGKRVNYRLRSRDLTSRSQAVAYCETVMAAGFSCLPIRQTGSPWRLVGTEPEAKVATVSPRTTAGSTASTAAMATVSESAVSKPDAASAKTRPAASAVDATGPLFKIQLAAYRDITRAVRGERILSKSLPGDFPRLEILKRNVVAEDPTRINYWVRSRGLLQKAHARALCDTARSAGHGCLLIEPTSTTWPPSVVVQ